MLYVVAWYITKILLSSLYLPLVILKYSDFKQNLRVVSNLKLLYPSLCLRGKFLYGQFRLRILKGSRECVMRC